MFHLFGMIREKGVNMISKELLGEVLNLKICIDDTHPYIQSNMLVYDVLNNDEINTNNINIYELAHKCKEWAIKYIANIGSGYDKDKGIYWCICNNGEFQFYADTELEAIFKACEWLLDNKED